MQSIVSVEILPRPGDAHIHASIASRPNRPPNAAVTSSEESLLIRKLQLVHIIRRGGPGSVQRRFRSAALKKLPLLRARQGKNLFGHGVEVFLAFGQTDTFVSKGQANSA